MNYRVVFFVYDEYTSTLSRQKYFNTIKLHIIVVALICLNDQLGSMVRIEMY